VRIADQESSAMPWSTPVGEPIAIKGRRPLRTLAEARGFILELDEEQRQSINWRTARDIIEQAAVYGEPYVSMAHLAISRALSKMR
jgi:hypothetical protein